MEPVIFIVALAAIGIACFWILGIVFGLIHRPAIWFPLKLATQMAVAAAIGAACFLVGAIALPTWLMSNEFKKRPDYKPVPIIVAGVVISSLALTATLFATFYIAPLIFD